jgi:hypothetical protein
LNPGDPAGNAGERIACGIIKRSKARPFHFGLAVSADQP